MTRKEQAFAFLADDDANDNEIFAQFSILSKRLRYAQMNILRQAHISALEERAVVEPMYRLTRAASCPSQTLYDGTCTTLADIHDIPSL